MDICPGGEGFFFIADNLEHFSVKLYDIHIMTAVKTFSIEEHIRKIYYLHGSLVIMPYCEVLLLVDVPANKYCLFQGTRSYISSVSINVNSHKEHVLIAAGTDHRIALHKLLNIVNWESYNEKEEIIQLSLDIKATNYGNIYSLGKYDNARDNLHDYGFGHVEPFAENHIFYCYDQKVKVIRLLCD